LKQIEWSEESLDDMLALDKEMVRSVKHAVERLAETGAGNVKKLQGIKPPSFAFVSATIASASIKTAPLSVPFASGTVAKLIADRFCLPHSGSLNPG
jgi:hypothetical protein